jgi:hypothetical protein
LEHSNALEEVPTRPSENPELPVARIVTYVPKAGKQAELLALVR